MIYEDGRKSFLNDIYQITLTKSKKGRQEQMKINIIIERLKVEPVLTKYLVDFVEQNRKLMNEYGPDFLDLIFAFLKQSEHLNAKLAERTYSALFNMMSRGNKNKRATLIALCQHLESHADFSTHIMELHGKLMAEGSEIVKQNDVLNRDKNQKETHQQSHLNADEPIANKSTSPALASPTSVETATTNQTSIESSSILPILHANGDANESTSTGNDSSTSKYSCAGCERLEKRIEGMEQRHDKQMEKIRAQITDITQYMDNRITHLEKLVCPMQLRNVMEKHLKPTNKKLLKKDPEREDLKPYGGKDNVIRLYKALHRFVHTSWPEGAPLTLDHSTFSVHKETIRLICDNPHFQIDECEFK